MKIVGVTKCPVGVAHTYMAAEKLEIEGKKLGYQMKIETQGSAGVENAITATDVAQADYVIIAADVEIDGKERFAGKKVLEVPIKSVLKNPDDVFKQMLEAKVMKGNKDSNLQNQASGKSSGIKQLMNGVSHMIPFVVVGGLFIALALAIGGTAGPTGMAVEPGSFWDGMLQVGVIGFNLMIPILAGFIAFSIAGRAALAPAMICAQVANSAAILGTEAGTGFLGAILVGFMAGYLVKWMNTWKVPKALRAIMPIFVIPIIGVGVISALLILVVGAPISWLMTGLETMLNSLAANPSTSVILGLILGAMVGVDMGGPINKVAFLFGVASIAAGNPLIMGAVACAIPVPPLSMGLATLIAKDKFDEEERAAGIPALLMGLIGITEGAIPFASADPKRALPSIIVGSAVAGAFGMIFKITDAVPHGGPIVGVLGATSNIVLFFVAIAIGTVIAALMVSLLKKKIV
ncbi:MAG: fructose-specific PTS transporter subunit EIIC [Clostridium sp.]